MKHFTIILALTVLLFMLSNTTFAGDSKSEVDVKESTIASLLEGLTSDNLGLKSSCAYMLGELKVTRAIIPLMRILHNDVNEGLRISSALALYKIGTPMSIYAVKQAGRFDESYWVNKLAQNFYAEYLREHFSNTDNTEADSLFAQGK
ncbi:MAG: HEAT repeat domain-containing protein [Bacteroidetes bacterium]|nr:HEAT repeat domain-containing protein [Bacteroidota bacterium]